MSFCICRIYNHWQNYNNNNLCHCSTNGSPVRKHCSFFWLVTHCRCHRTIWNIYTGIAYRTPKDIGKEHPEYLKSHWLICKVWCEDQKRCHCNRTCKTTYPWSKFSLCSISGTVYYLSHSYVRKSIHYFCCHHQCSHKCCTNTHDICIKFHHKQCCDNKS